jgi:MoaA/NifB/PqqE/SkfB family radical SAM enzyme
MIERLLKIFRPGKRRSFSAWQIELTTRCPLRCRMCAREEEAPWQNQEMTLDDFRQILPYLTDVETVVLEGWGESLLHKDLSQCIQLVKEKGAQVGFVTSGFGLTRDRVEEIIRAGVDFVGFSVSGACPETHDAIRINSHLPDLLAAIRLFHEEKQRLGLVQPHMHIIYLMVKDNILEVPSIPSLAKGVGIAEVVLTNLCHTVNRWQETQGVFLREEAATEYERLIGQAEVNARKLNIRLKRPSLTAIDVPVCAENPLRNLYISAEGEVSPCVYLHPPLPSPFKRIFCGREYRVERVSFGNIFRDPFPAIWRCGDYKDFRSRFIEREKIYRDLYFSLLDNPTLKSAQGIVLPEPPEPCKSCHKILGV